ncbi:hypothetical protein FML14_07060 [Klebsiella oxytoca]|uniref:hypothetical protein n=1 Tax=Klebsiella oxytoca TaxID=571 RepID=UPI001CCCAA2F|nr:hypothetical protein [Klebsiella oxytoca]MBZ7588421.1 hypothetical protein [Klebsiella oxytoca]
MMSEPTKSELLNAKIKIERDKRIRNTAIVVPAILGLTFVLYGYYFTTNNSSDIILISKLLGPLLIILSAFFILTYYLQTGFKNQTIEDEIYKNKKQIETSSTTNTTNLIINNQEDISNIKDSIKLIEDKINAIESFDELLPPNQTEEIVNTLKTRIVSESISEASKDILNNINENLKKNFNIFEVDRVLTQTIKRLDLEIDTLSRRGNINLSCGVVTTVIGLGVLAYFVYEIGTPPLNDNFSYIANFIPRLSVVILIEVFAFFFLKLYKSTLSEMKYFQNEITNTEAKLAAIKCSIVTSDKDGISTVINELIKTERNAIIEKGQTTVEIEKNRIEQHNTTLILDKITKILAVKK